MKKTTLLILATIVFILSCSKSNSPITPRNGVNQSLLTNKWWMRSDSSEHCFFNINGQYIYVKGNPGGGYLPPFNPTIDTPYSNSYGTWSWGTNDSIKILGTYRGTHFIKNLSNDTLDVIMNVYLEIDSNLTNPVYSYSKTWIKR
jgi:hypothetical protein